MPMVQVDYYHDPDPRSVRLRVVERGDYVGDEAGLHYDPEGRPVMAVHTDRPDGSYDTAVYAATARAVVEARR